MKNSNIEWTTHTFNPWIGCTKVSAGCLHCYAEARDKRYEGGTHWGKGAERRRTTVQNWGQPFKWDMEARKAVEHYHATFQESMKTGIGQMPERPRVFCASLADVFDDEVPIEWLGDLMDVVRLAENLDWLLLTKRPENIRPRLNDLLDPTNYKNQGHWDRGLPRRTWIEKWIIHETPPANVWLGTSVENQEAADKRIPELLRIPSQIKFLSCEPLLGPVAIGDQIAFIDWVIVGGESGAGARPMEEAWARAIRDDCDESPAAFFMKQMGGAADKHGELLDLPEELRIRQFP